MIKIIADDRIPFLKGILEPYARVIYLPGREINRDAVSGADALLIRTRTKCNAGLLEGSQVKFIGTATIGYDHIDTVFCKSANITWKNAPGCNSSSVKQYVTASLLSIFNAYMVDPEGLTLGVVGAGNVGSKVAQTGTVLGMNVLLNDPPRERREGSSEFTDLDKVLMDSDVLTLHVPLTEEGADKTRHLINEKTILKLKKGAWLVNSSRGEVVDTESLKKSLDSGRLAGSVIDVWENEPDIDRELLQMSFISTPHIAGYSADGKANGTSMIVNELAGFFGLPLTDWYPEDIPQPSVPLMIEIETRGKKDVEIVTEAVQKTYNIDNDDLALRYSPDIFELWRENYPVRREFTAFKVRLKGNALRASVMLEELGFSIIRG